MRAESLINDGTALLLYSIAVAATVGEMEVTALNVSGSLLLSYVGGVVAGLLVAGIGVLVRRRLVEAMTENIAILLNPFTASCSPTLFTHPGWSRDSS